MRSGLKNLGDSKAALEHLRGKAETDRSKGGGVHVVLRTAAAILGGWVECQRAVAFPLHRILH